MTPEIIAAGTALIVALVSGVISVRNSSSQIKRDALTIANEQIDRMDKRLQVVEAENSTIQKSMFALAMANATQATKIVRLEAELTSRDSRIVELETQVAELQAKQRQTEG